MFLFLGDLDIDSSIAFTVFLFCLASFYVKFAECFCWVTTINDIILIILYLYVLIGKKKNYC